ncbi:MAG: hypothetical protein AAFQ14_14435 [Cyanobacteria bacterium J06621_12]
MSLPIFKPRQNSVVKTKTSIFGISSYWLCCIPLVVIILVASNTAAIAQDNAIPLSIEDIQGC